MKLWANPKIVQKLPTNFQRRIAFAPTMGCEAETFSAFSNTTNREARQISAPQPHWLEFGTPPSCEMVGSFSNLCENSPQISSLQRRIVFAPNIGHEAETLSSFSSSINSEPRQVSASQPKVLGFERCNMDSHVRNLFYQLFTCYTC